MKKFLVLSLVAVCAAFFSMGCKPADKAADATPATEPAATETTEPAATEEAAEPAAAEPTAAEPAATEAAPAEVPAA